MMLFVETLGEILPSSLNKLFITIQSSNQNQEHIQEKIGKNFLN